MSKRARQYISILFAIIAYYIVHEGAHLIVALALHTFKKINFMGIGIQIDIYRDRLTDMQLGLFCIAGVTATVIMLVLDPIYLCLLSGAFGGGDVNGILYLMPQAWVWTIFAFILLFNIWILLKKVNPTYTASFKEK